MELKKRERVTKVFIAKGSPVWHIIDDHINRRFSSNPIREWKHIVSLYSDPFIRYTVDGTDHKEPISEKVKMYPFYSITSNGDYCMIVPDTRHLSMKIRKKHAGKDIRWNNRMGVWTKTLIHHVIKMNEEKIHECK